MKPWLTKGTLVPEVFLEIVLAKERVSREAVAMELNPLCFECLSYLGRLYMLK